MNDEQPQAQFDTAREPVGGPALARVRRRGESHLLAFISSAVVVLVAIAIAKPWGEGAPPPGASASIRSPLARIAASPAEGESPSATSPPWELMTGTETTPYVVIAQPGQVPGDSTVTCTFIGASAEPTGTETWDVVVADPSGAQYSGDGSATGPADDTVLRTCADVTVYLIEPVSPSPTAP